MSQNWAVGKNGKVTFSGTDLCVTGWTFNEAGDSADTTNTCGNNQYQPVQDDRRYAADKAGP